MTESNIVCNLEHEWERPDFDLQVFIKRRSIITYLDYFRYDEDPDFVREPCREHLLQFLATLGLDFRKAEQLDYDDPVWMVEVCKFLLDLGADINATVIADTTALFFAIHLKHPEPVIDFLLDNKIDYTTKLRLHQLLVESCDRESVLRLFIRRCIDADIEAQSGDGIISFICNGLRYETILRITNVMKEMISYSKPIEVKIYEYLGCLAMCLGSHPFAYSQWEKAVQLRAAYNIRDGSGLPYNDVDMFKEDIKDKGKMVYLFFVVAANENREKAVASEWIELIKRGFYTLWSLPHSDVLSIGELLLNAFSDKWSGIDPLYQVNCIGLLASLCNLLWETAKNDQEKKALNIKFISNLVRKKLVVVDYTPTILFYYISRLWNWNHDLCNEMIKLLLECGMDNSARDREGFTAYHSYVQWSKRGNWCSELILDLFIENGCHIDEKLPGKENLTVCQFLKSNNVAFNEFKHVNLKCLAARVIVDKNIAYSKEDIPRELVSFIEIHK